MNGNRPRVYEWMQLARGIPLAGLLALSACSSGMPRETPQVSLKNAVVTGEAVKHSPAALGAANSLDATESRKPISTVSSEEKNGVAEHSIYFSDGKASLSEENIKVLRQQAEYLKQNPKLFIVFRAYLDSLGSRTFSVAIAQKRLNIVVEKLRHEGVAKSRIRQVMVGQRGNKPTCEAPSCQNVGGRIEFFTRKK